ncbi:MAG: thioredoxin [Halieaceae bacterium]|nr:thioredoxin [Halieaceae bacterium]MAI94811.1 thioredoxin [Halieaceae bacterium]|tara:strand:+ start:561 stop:1421 length:861 start_codon:yes stop_codon:yes gene_type:complete
MNAANYIVDIDESNAQTLLIEESQKRPVIVDFWADWCAPCKQLMPILEKLAAEYQGAFLLAKVNADEQQMLAQQLGVRSLPTVMVIKDGQPVDGFSGAQPESAVRDMLDKHVPSPQADSLAEAEQLLAEGDIPGALALFRGAWEDSGQKPEFTMAYAGALITANRLDEAEALLSDIKMVDQDARYQQLMAQIELQRQAARSPEIEALEADLASDEQNHEIRIKLAVQLSSHGRYREALEHLLVVLRADRDWGNGEAKRVYLDMIATIGKGDPLAAEYQRKLFSLLY